MKAIKLTITLLKKLDKQLTALGASAAWAIRH
jgi:hypothetical protein